MSVVGVLSFKCTYVVETFDISRTQYIQTRAQLQTNTTYKFKHQTFYLSPPPSLKLCLRGMLRGDLPLKVAGVFGRNSFEGCPTLPSPLLSTVNVEPRVPRNSLR